MTFTVAGAPTASLSITSTPALPAGVSLTQTPGGPTLATIAGTAATTGIYTLSVAVTSAGYNNLETATLTVASRPLITSANTASGVAGRAFTFNVTTSGFPAPAITMAGALPAGITLVDHGNGTATIAGTAPDEQGGRTYPITLSATNAVGTADQSFTLALDRVPQFTSAPPAAIVADVPVSFSIMTVGSPTPVITETGALPPGLTLQGPARRHRHDLRHGTELRRWTIVPDHAHGDKLGGGGPSVPHAGRDARPAVHERHVDDRDPRRRVLLRGASGGFTGADHHHDGNTSRRRPFRLARQRPGHAVGHTRRLQCRPVLRPELHGYELLRLEQSDLHADRGDADRPRVCSHPLGSPILGPAAQPSTGSSPVAASVRRARSWSSKLPAEVVSRLTPPPSPST